MRAYATYGSAFRNLNLRCACQRDGEDCGVEVEGIDHIALSVRDVEKSARWYIEVLGFERRHEGMWGGIPVFVGKGNTALALFPPRDNSSGNTRMRHFAVRATRENFRAAQNELKERAIAFEFEDHEISHSIYFRDPDGYEIEITTYEVS